MFRLYFLINTCSYITGSIADREHRKWTEKAIPLQNNPYTKESIERRLQRISGDVNTGLAQNAAYGNEASVEDKNVGKRSKSGNEANSSEPRRIDCGLKSVDPSLYRRDYYVNSNGKNQYSTVNSSDSGSSTKSDASSSTVSDDGNYSCSDGSTSTEDRTSSYLSSPEMSRNSDYSSKKAMESFRHQNSTKVHTYLENSREIKRIN